ncbi:metalloregulator ArsR/SmtB family transcription factor [Variovorax sp. J22P240]|uniref:ArsR/SmtB family transcription factor n=1 Tax=unclassified Variovorax TaxID=663243 RepID=UPI002574BD03|nr:MULTISPECIES: metalloregulator ArsR/SmtB family transcription factor [unclassified Variovorax]MDL9998060.1 metalloregulator ArsR/SmtB family transcription factor [Variovorax sp. J22P240]MDM0053496.1 metalloregulator ArsR/SmtB family transcription factor [Variovorax sp. J22R115]
MEENDAVRSLAALAQGARLRVFRALVIAGHQGMTPGVMAEGSGIPPATLSFHLKELMNAGLVSQERQGRKLIYRASFDRMNALLGYLAENCCQGEACAVDAATTCSC